MLSPRGTNTTVVDFALLRFTVNDSTNFNIPQRWELIEVFQPIRTAAMRFTRLAMKTSLVIALTVAFVLAGGSALAVMNKACKSGHHPWCAPTRTHIRVGT